MRGAHRHVISTGPRPALRTIAPARANDFFQVPPRETLLLHAKLDRVDRVRLIHRIVLGFMHVDQGREYVEPVSLPSAYPRAPSTLGLGQRRLVIRLRANGLDTISQTPPSSRPA